MLRLVCYTLIGLCLTVGCDETHKPTPGTYIPAISVAVGVAETESGAPAPEPDTPSDVCENCGGTGKVGDGTVFVVCPVCEGTGKTTPPPRTTTQHRDATTAATGPGASPPSISGASGVGTTAEAVPAGASRQQPGYDSPHTADKDAAESHEATQAGTTPAAATLPAGLSPGEQPTPMAGVGAVYAALRPQPGERLVVFGSGYDARYEIVAARDYGLTSIVGIEINPALAQSARRFVRANGVSDRVQILTGDATQIKVDADIGAAYLWPDVLEQLAPQIRKLDRFASYAHPVPGLEMTVVRTSGGTVYLWERPKPQPIQWQQIQQPVAVWKGRTYTAPVCSSPNCSMCRSLRAQLYQ